MPIKPTPAGGYEVSVCVNYRRAHRRLPAGTTARDAKRVEAGLIAELQAQQRTIQSQHGDPPLMAALAAYIERSHHLRSPDTAVHHAQRIGQWCEPYRCSQARQAAAHILRDMRGRYAPATINRSLGALKHGLRLLWDAGRTPVDHGAAIKRLPEHNARHTWLSLEQVRELADHASPPVRAAIWITVLTGCRRGEALAIRPHMIGPEWITLPAGATKTLRTRTIPIIAPLRPWLAHIGPDGLGVTFEGVKSAWRRAREAVGRPDLQFRDLRRSTGTLLIQTGAPLHHVSQILGHASTAVTERVYAHLAGSQLAGSMQQLERLHQALHQGTTDAA